MTKSLTGLWLAVSCGVLGVGIGAGSAMIAAPANGVQRYPGQPTDARVWIENRTRPEAIASSLETPCVSPRLAQRKTP